MHLHRYRFRLRVLERLRFPAFPGPALRGALGEHPETYRTLFRPPAALPQKRFSDPPRPLALRPRFEAGECGRDSAVEVDVTLVGCAGAHFPALLRGMARAGERGVGADRDAARGLGCFRIERVDAIGPGGTEPVVTPDGWLRPVSRPWHLPQDFGATSTASGGGLTVRFLTPTLVRRGGDPRGSLELVDVVEDLVRRVSLLASAYGDGPVYGRPEELAMTDAAARVRIDDAAVRWVEVPRFSRTQGQAMTFGGWVGWVRYGADPGPWTALMRAGELLHVGKHTTFGFGAIELAA